jgi:L-xylulokinase
VGVYLMGIDIGSTLTKAAIYDLSGNEIAAHGAKCSVLMPQAGYYERNMDDIWQANIDAISEAIQRSGISAKEIAAVSLTGHGNGIHLVDEQGLPVYNSIESSDSRANNIVDQWMKDGTFEKTHPKNMQSLWPALSACLAAWMTENRPREMGKARWVFSVTDYVRFMLTGEPRAEITILSGSGLYNNSAGKYDPEMLADMGLEAVIDKLPPVAQSEEICGRITKRAAELTGLPEGTPVAAGLYDIDSAGLAVGMTDETKMNIIVGTWCNNQFISREPLISKEFFSTTKYAVGGYWLMLEGSPTSASNLEWFVNEFLQEEKSIAQSTGTSVYSLCNDAVASTLPDETKIVFLPFLYGSNAGPHAKAALVGMEGWHKRAHIIRAIYEGICFSHRWHIEKLFQYRSRPSTARIAGGAARSKPWVRMFADVLQLPMEVTAATELGTLGAAICAGVAAGLFSSYGEAVEKMVKIVERIEPDAKNFAVYEEKYRRYKKAIKNLADFWE